MNDILKTIEQAKAQTVAEGEASRILTICNACRYCEGFCAVFPAMTRRISFDKADVHYLANLCHNCGACLHACQYAPPHEFAVNVPQTMAGLRTQTYADYAWPASFSKLYQRNGLAVAVSLTFGLALFLILTLVFNGGLITQGLNANFYAIFPHNFLALIFGSVFGFALLAMGIGVRKFWREVAANDNPNGVSTLEAAHNALTLKYLDGNSNASEAEGCTNEDDAPTQWRRRFHHFTFYGFMLCFASTSVATLYHYFFGLEAPYDLGSLPVVLGTLGGASLMIGTAGLAHLYAKRHKNPAPQKPMDLGFMLLLFFTSMTGLLLLIWRSTASMPLLLALHLGVIMALFLTLPFSKMVHGVYRSAALLKWAIERKRPNGIVTNE